MQYSQVTPECFTQLHRYSQANFYLVRVENFAQPGTTFKIRNACQMAFIACYAPLFFIIIEFK